MSIPWLKALHLIFMVTWFAGLFYLPRLFVYHAMNKDPNNNETFKVMEKKLYYGITTPGGILTLVFGMLLLRGTGWSVYAGSHWLQVKLFCVFLLVLYHLFCGKLLVDFKHERNTRNHVWYRWFNEIPAVLLVVIIVMAVVRPI